jgi:hypothetical protein
MATLASLKRVALVPVLVLALAAASSSGCHSALEDYDDYLSRRPGGAGEQQVQSTLQDLNGSFLLHALLAGGLDLGLRVDLQMDLARTPIPLHARMWLAAADTAVEPPLVETDTTVAPDGTFTLHAEPLVLAKGAAPGLNVDVLANVVLDAATQSPTAWCGTATGTVDKPLSLDLAGSTFAARRDDAHALKTADVPPSCFPRGANPDGGGVVETPKPMPPDLSSVPSMAADVSGDWLLNASLAGSVPLQLWASLKYTQAADGTGALDGALRRATDPIGSVALTTFSTAVTADGRFEIWMPQLQVGTVDASVLLVGATHDADSFCGAGAGRVHKPIDLDLKGTTFGAIRWTPGTPLPTAIPNRCQ